MHYATGYELCNLKVWAEGYTVYIAGGTSSLKGITLKDEEPHL